LAKLEKETNSELQQMKAFSPLHYANVPRMSPPICPIGDHFINVIGPFRVRIPSPRLVESALAFPNFVPKHTAATNPNWILTHGFVGDWIGIGTIGITWFLTKLNSHAVGLVALNCGNKSMERGKGIYVNCNDPN
jgi:hypothetical protein